MVLYLPTFNGLRDGWVNGQVDRQTVKMDAKYHYATPLSAIETVVQPTNQPTNLDVQSCLQASDKRVTWHFWAAAPKSCRTPLMAKITPERPDLRPERGLTEA